MSSVVRPLSMRGAVLIDRWSPLGLAEGELLEEQSVQRELGVHIGAGVELRPGLARGGVRELAPWPLPPFGSGGLELGSSGATVSTPEEEARAAADRRPELIRPAAPCERAADGRGAGKSLDHPDKL